MGPYTLLFAALFDFVAAGIYIYVGWQLGRRQLSGQEAQLAWRLFIVWWFGLGATTLIGGVMNLLGAAGFTSLALFVGLTHLNLLSICAALWGLLYYLLYLFTGKKQFLAPLSLFYVAYYILLVYYLNFSRPTGVILEAWHVTLQYEKPPAGFFLMLVLIFLVFPQIIGSGAYFSLYSKVQEPTQKYRILLVSWSIIIWFSSAFLASLTGFSEQYWWQIAARLIGLAAAFAIYLAYFPPGWIKQRYHVRSINEPTAVID